MPWNLHLARTFWNNYRQNYILKYDDREARVRNYNDSLANRNAAEQGKKQSFFNASTFCEMPTNASGSNSFTKKCDAISFWIKYCSWTYCSNCQKVSTKKMPSSLFNRPGNKILPLCTCKTDKYVVPKKEDIPIALRNLTMMDNIVLRPFVLLTGRYKRASNGYRLKTSAMRIVHDRKSVQEKIAAVTDLNARQRCQNAYEFLMNSSDSSYSKFVNLREHYMYTNESFNVFHSTEAIGIECALWPSLYPFTRWCETAIEGSIHRESCKISFFHKIFSSVIDYSLYFDLVQFQYDRWIYKTVTGAVNSARREKCSPARSLDAKTFSTGYWRWQHRFLVDAVRQFGFPDVFITLSPYEWTFPLPAWLERIREETGYGPTELPAFETIHFAHVLEQIARGYLTGCSDKRWKNHVFNYNNTSQSNVNAYFYRFEFQKRGTVHMHLLIWLKNIEQVQYNLIRAEFPEDNKELAYLAFKHQKSDKKSSSLNLQVSETHFNHDDAGNSFLRLKHPPTAFAQNLRAYISTLLPTLQCSMDFQTTDGHGMLLRYVTSYVSKFNDGISSDSLYSYEVSPVQLAYRFLTGIKPLEPEMWMSLSSMKISWTSARTKRFTIPSPEKVRSNALHLRYCARSRDDEQMSFLDWLRAYDTETFTRYKRGYTLVGVRYRSYFKDEFFFQYLLMYYPHKKLSDIILPRWSSLPRCIKYFAGACTLMPEIWTDFDKVREMLKREGNKDYFIDTAISHVRSLTDTFHMWKFQILTSENLNIPIPQDAEEYCLDEQQELVKQYVQRALVLRNNFYSQFSSYNNQENNRQEDIAIASSVISNNFQQTGPTSECQWKQPVLLIGKPGSGKTRTILAIAKACVRSELKVLICCPTGILASRYRNIFPPNVEANTVHSAFNLPVKSSDEPSINYDISQYDIVIIDEISMVSKKNFRHVFDTINTVVFRPVFLLAGDEAQQQPIVTISGRIFPTHSVLEDRRFVSICRKFRLTSQFRCSDTQLQNFLNTIRHWIPSNFLLQNIQTGRVLCENSAASTRDILDSIHQYSGSTFITVSRAACNRVNMCVINNMFKDKQSLACIQMDCDLPILPVYKDMKVMITQNRNKDLGVINGQFAIVSRIQGCTVFLKLNNNTIVPTYPVTIESGKVLYPFSPGYAITICKAQGQTIPGAIVWFDVDTVPIGSAYVALSRVKNLDDLRFFTPLKVCHFKPVCTDLGDQI